MVYTWDGWARAVTTVGDTECMWARESLASGGGGVAGQPRD